MEFVLDETYANRNQFIRTAEKGIKWGEIFSGNILIEPLTRFLDSIHQSF